MNRLRIAQVITRFVRGGAQQVVQQLLEKLPAGEFEQALICGSDGAEGNPLLSKAAETGAGVTVLRAFVREIRPALDGLALLRLTAALAQLRPDVVHAHTYKAGVLSSVAARLAGVPSVVFSPHGHIFASGAGIPGVPKGARLELLRWITRAAQARVDRVTALSDPDCEQQVALGLSPASKYVVIRNGIDVERFALPRARLFEGSPVVGAVGRFSEEKGHRFLLLAMPRILRYLPGARLVLVGYGEGEPGLRALSARLGLDPVVVFAGERESAEVLASFDVFVQPSLYESQGIALLEAMAAGVPVVATDVGGVRDVVQHGETGLLAPPSDPESLAAAVILLAKGPEQAAVLARRASRRVGEKYSSSAMAEAYARLYRELSGGYNPRPCTTS